MTAPRQLPTDPAERNLRCPDSWLYDRIAECQISAQTRTGQGEAEDQLYILRAEGEEGIAPPKESSKELLDCWIGERRVAAKQEPGKGVGEVRGALHLRRAQTCRR